MSIPACHVGDLGSIPRRSDRRGHLENTRRSACDNRPSLFVHILLVIRPNLSQRRGLCCGGQNTRHAQKQKQKKLKKTKALCPAKFQNPNFQIPKPQKTLSAPDGMPYPSARPTGCPFHSPRSKKGGNAHNALCTTIRRALERGALCVR